MSEYTSANMPNRMPERISDYMPDKMPNRTPQRMPDGISEYLPDIMLISECYILYVRLAFFKLVGITQVASILFMVAILLLLWLVLTLLYDGDPLHVSWISPISRTVPYPT